jgi:hypothetical protein
LQSLTLLNDQGFVEMAQGLAKRVLKEAMPVERIDYAFQLCLARKPSSKEKQRLEDLLTQQVADFTAAPEEAARIIAPSESGPEPAQLAAWTTVSRVLLNLDETITRE